MGFGRDATIAATMGLDRSADVAVFLVSLPDFLVNVLGAGGITAILVIRFRQFPSLATRLLFQVSILGLFASCALAAVLLLADDLVLDLLSPGFDSVSRSIAKDLLPLSLLAVPLAAIASVLVGFLQSEERFFVASLGAFVINCALIAAMLLAPQGKELEYLALGIALGAFGRWLLLHSATGKRVFSGLGIRPWLIDRGFLLAVLRTAAGDAIVFFYPFALRAIATLFGIGALASVNYATKLVQLPLGVVVMTLTTILLPRLAGVAPREGSGDLSGFRRLAEQGQYWILGLSMVSVSILIVHGAWLVEIAFGWGEIGAEGLATIALYNAVFSLSLLPMGLNVFLRRSLNALGDTRAPLHAEIAGFAAFMILAVLVLASVDRLEWVLAAAAAGNLFSTAVLLRASHRRDVPLARALLRPSVWLLIPLAGVAAAVPGLALQALAPGNLWLPLAAIAVGGSAALGLLIGVNADARATLRSLLRRAPAQ